MANELAKSANLRCRLEGVVFFRHFLRRTDDRAAHKRVKPFFARGNRVRGRSGRRRWFLLPQQSNGNCRQCNKHKTKSFVHETPFGESCHLAGHKGRSFRTPAIYYTHEVPSCFASDSKILGNDYKRAQEKLTEALKLGGLPIWLEYRAHFELG